MANLNDTDGDGTVDGTVDRDDENVSVSGPNPPGRNEIDLMKLVLKKPVPDHGGNATLTLKSGDVKLWEQSTKVTPFTLTGGKRDIPTSQLPKTLWVEARSASASIRDIVIELKYKCAKDVVKATAVWVTKTDRSPWCTRQSADGFPDNPVPGAGKDLPDVDSASILTLINDYAPNGFRAANGSRYGYGTFAANAAGGTEARIGGRILYEFEVHPAGVEALGVVFDVTRQVERRSWYIIIAHGTLNTDANDPPEDFPWKQAPVRDNELGNDDISSDDEDNVPKNAHVYSFDSPSVLRGAGFNAFTIQRYTFKEWVRMQVNNAAFASGESVQGTRCSPKYDWHLLNYLKRDCNGYLVPDNTNPSYNDPLLSNPNANGTISVTLLDDSVTEGFRAKYDLANLKWTLTGTSGDSASDSKASAPPGTKWTISIGTKIKVELTQGTAAFADADFFAFSVFKSLATEGKKTEIAPGEISATDGP